MPLIYIIVINKYTTTEALVSLLDWVCLEYFSNVGNLEALGKLL